MKRSVNEWISPQSAAKLADVSVNYLCKLAKKKGVQAKKTAKGNLYQKASIQKYADTRPRRTQKKSSKASEWVDNTTATKLVGLTRSGVEYASRAGYIRRKKVNGTFRYSSADCAAYPKQKHSKASEPANNQPAYMNAVTGRMRPKQAQTAVQKARWVFEGLDMGNLSAGNALNIIRNAMYEDSN